MAGTSLLAVDVGGTFTDVVGVAGGEVTVIKVPTDHVRSERGVLAGAAALGVEGRAVFNHASTAGLNALLTRRLPKIGFLTTAGHRDMLDSARSWRPFDALTDPNWRKSFGDSTAPLVPRYLRRGIAGRILTDGSELTPLDEDQLREEIDRLARCGVEGVAVCLLNSYVNDTHEQRVREVLGERLGELPCSISAEVSPLAKEYPRAVTTVIDVAMKRVYGAYTTDLDSGLADLGFSGTLNFADSAATLTRADQAMERPYKIVFSGPAAGAVASARFGELTGDGHLICADIGGTSCDISIVTDGSPVLRVDFELEPDLPINSPSIEISSLGAGGGSIISSDPSGELQVGPRSAGSDPGPACYGRGGAEPTMTDACVLLGILDPTRFNDGELHLDPDLSREAFERLGGPLEVEDRVRFAYEKGLDNIAQGILELAIAQGIDPRRHSLIAYGAAGPLLLPAILDHVHARRVIVPPYPGLFSALGLLSAEQAYSDSRTMYAPLAADRAAEIDEIYATLEERLASQCDLAGAVSVSRTFDARLAGQSWETPFVPAPDGRIDGAAVGRMRASFHDAYQRRFGNRFEQHPVQGVTYRVDIVVPSEKIEFPLLEREEAGEPVPERQVDVAGRPTAVFERGKLGRGAVVHGPAIVGEPTSTTHIQAGQRAEVGVYGELLIEREEEP